MAIPDDEPDFDDFVGIGWIAFFDTGSFQVDDGETGGGLELIDEVECMCLHGVLSVVGF